MFTGIQTLNILYIFIHFEMISMTACKMYCIFNTLDDKNLLQISVVKINNLKIIFLQ